MKNVIRLLTVSIFILSSTGVFAQTFGIKGGLNLSTVYAADDNGSNNDDLKLNPGLNIGATIEFPISEMFSIESGLIISTKGTRTSMKETFAGITYKTTTRANLFYLDIPVNARVNIPVGNLKIYATAGPYVGVGMAGLFSYKYKIDGKIEDRDSDSISWGNEEFEDDAKRLDFGISAGAGVQFNAIEVGISYALGLANISPYTANGYKNNNRVFSILVGYKFLRE